MNPFNWWKWGEDVWWVKLNSWAKCLNSSSLNGGPLSVITTAGMPSVENRSLKYLSVLWWCVIATGKTNRNFSSNLQQFKNLFPESSWKKSIPSFTHGLVGTSCGCNVSTGIFELSCMLHTTWHSPLHPPPFLANTHKSLLVTRISLHLHGSCEVGQNRISAHCRNNDSLTFH